MGMEILRCKSSEVAKKEMAIHFFLKTWYEQT